MSEKESGLAFDDNYDDDDFDPASDKTESVRDGGKHNRLEVEKGANEGGPGAA